MSDIRHMAAPSTHSQTKAGGETIDRHQHDNHQLVYVSSGVVAIRTELGSWVASSDRALWIPAHTWHEHRFYGKTRFHTIGFTAKSIPLSVDAPTVIAVDALLRSLLVALTCDELTPNEAKRIRGVLADRLKRAEETPFNLPAPCDPRLVEACRIVEDDMRTPMTLTSIASQVHTSERSLSRLFRAELKMTYPQWRTQTRVFAAMVLLAQGESVTDTAHSCGWSTVSAFVDIFSRTMGVTPGTHRKRNI